MSFARRAFGRERLNASRGLLAARLRHEAEKDQKGYGGGAAEGEKRDAIAKMIDDDADGQCADRGADSLGGRNRALGQIVAAGAAHDVGDDEWRERLVDTRSDPVQQLDSDEPE